MDDNLDVRSRILLKTSNSVESAGPDFVQDDLNSSGRVLEIRHEAALRR